MLEQTPPAIESSPASASDAVVDELYQKWLTSESERAAQWKEIHALRHLVIDLQSIVASLQPKESKPFDLGERLETLAKMKGVKGLADELHISERSYHRLRVGGGSARLREDVRGYLNAHGLRSARSSTNGIPEIPDGLA